MANEAIATLGNVFGLVNIAGAAMPKPLLQMSRQDWKNTWNVNVTSLFNWSHAILPHMLESERGGRIINNSSVSGKQGGDENSVSRAAYAAAKAGVMGITRGLAREVAPKSHGERNLPWARSQSAYDRALQCSTGNDGAAIRWRAPGIGADIAKAVIYFMAADWVTGEITDVNGGYFID